MNAIEYTALADLVHAQDIPCIQGTVKNLYPPKSGTGKYGEWKLQSGKIADGKGLQHDIVFKDAAVNPDLVGKQITIECGRDKFNKLAGLKMNVRSYTDKSGQQKTVREVSVDNRATVIVSVASGASATQVATDTNQRSSGSTQSVSVQTEVIPVSERVKDYFEVLDLVAKEVGRDPKEVRDALSVTDLKDITTGQVMSFKKEYGLFGRVDFGRTVKPAETKNAEGEYTWNVGWKNYVYPPTNKGKCLDQYTEEKLREFAIWSVVEPTTDKNREAKAQISLMAGEKGWTASVLFNDKFKSELAYGTAFESSDVDAVLFNSFGLDSLDALNDDQCSALLKKDTYKQLLDECVERGTSAAPEEFPA